MVVIDVSNLGKALIGREKGSEQNVVVCEMNFEESGEMFLKTQARRQQQQN
jgi:hypothetical protein